jgi:hypothetical protein
VFLVSFASLELGEAQWKLHIHHSVFDPKTPSFFPLGKIPTRVLAQNGLWGRQGDLKRSRMRTICKTGKKMQRKNVTSA